MSDENDRYLRELIAAEQEQRLRLADICDAVRFGIRMAWNAGSGRVITIVSAQLVQAAGLGAALLLLNQTLQWAFTSAGEQGAIGAVLAPLVTLLVIGTLGAIIAMTVSVQHQILALRIERDAVVQVAAAASKAELIDFERPAFYNRMERAVWAAEIHVTRLLSGVLSMLNGALTMLAVVIAVVTMAWWLLPLLGLAVAPLVQAGLQRRRAEYAMEVHLMDNRRFRGYLLRLLTGRDEAKEIRAFGLASLLTGRLADQYAERLAWERTFLRRYLIRDFLAHGLSTALIVTGAAVALLLVSMGWLETSVAVTVLGGCYLVAGRISLVSSMLSEVSGALPFIRDLRLFVMDTPDTRRRLERGPTSGFTVLEARHLRFTYPGSDTPALDDVCLTLRAGEVVALVGHNGSGKSTLAKILTGLYRPDSGQLWWDGQPLSDPERLRAVSTVLFQDFLRYKFTAADNIGIGHADRMDDTTGITRAAQRAGADDFIQRLPQGYQTLLSTEFTGGVDLSLGQWQRVALARAFFRDAPFVVLDEPTASLDPRAEAELFARIRELFTDRTVLLISHRFASVRYADRIYVLDAGRVIEWGTHEELMAASGAYAEMFLLQAAAYQDSYREESASTSTAGE